MNIQIRVIAAQAQKQLAAIQAQTRGLGAAGSTGAGGMARLNKAMNPANMIKFGSQTQWTGRQLTRNFTMPLLLAGGAATKFALDNEAAFKRVVKVYGDIDTPAQQITNETNALKKAFEALSNEFGVNQTEVLKVAGDWAAAGASGIALARSTKLTLQTMVLGEIDAAKATEALIAIQAQYGMKVGELGEKHVGAAKDVNSLAETIGVLNIVENQTGVQMAGLIDSMARSAGVARSSGVSIRELAAMTAALVPASGSAAAAGNALKTMFSRMMSPTQEAGQVLHEMGVNFDENAWKSKNAAERLRFVANEYKKLGDGVTKTSAVLDENGKPTGRFISAQQAVASSVIASRWQINRFDVLMGSLNDETGYYAKAIKASADANRNAAQAQKELNIVLESSPHRLKQMGVILQNSLADVIQPMIPALIVLASYIAKGAQAFANMNPYMQKFIVIGLAALAILGPMLIFFGSLITATGEIAKIFKVFLAPLRLVVAGVWGLATAPFKLIAFGFASIGRAAVGGVGFALKFVNGLKYLTAMSVLSGGVQGVVAKKFVAAWVFARTTVLLNLAAMRITFLATLQQMVAATAGFFAKNLTASFSATFIGLYQGLALRMTAMLTVMRARYVAMVGTSALAWGAMALSAKLRMREMLAVVTVGMARMLTPVYRWGVASVGIIGFTMARMEGAMAMAVARMSALWTAFLVRWTGAVMVAGSRTVAIWLLMNSGLLKVQAKATALLTRVWAAGLLKMVSLKAIAGARIVALSAAINTRIMKIWVAGSTLLRTMWTAVWGAMVAIKTFAATNILRIAVTMQTRMFAIHALGLAKLRALWVATFMFLASPARLMGSLAMMGRAFATLPAMLMKLGPLIFRALTGPVGLAITAVIALAYVFRDQLKQLWTNIGQVMKGTTGAFAAPIKALADLWHSLVGSITKNFNRLPEGVQNAMIAVVNVVKNAVKAVYKLFSYMNPFAHHSPSLVENVTNGMAAVQRQYAETGDAANAMTRSVSTGMAAVRREAGITADSYAKMITDANNMAKSLSDMAANVGTSGKYSDERKDVAKVAPQALPTFDSLVNQLRPLDEAMNVVQKAVTDQQIVVNDWQKKLDDASATVDKHQNKLDDLQKTLDKLKDGYDKAKDAMTELASAPITGMGAMSDSIFENSMAQKKLQLQIMKWEDVNGSLEDTKKKIDKLSGAIETAQGDIAEMRQGGAGSDLLGPMNEQLDAMMKQRTELEKTVNDSPVSDMQKELDKLARTGQMLDLENSIQFDPLTRQIDQLANGMAELPFDEIIAGITEQKKVMDDLKPKIDDATAAVDRQKTVLDDAQVARDKVQASYDAEAARLDVLKNKYDELSDAMSNVKQALGDISGAASGQLEAARTKAEHISPGLQNFRDAAGGSFPDPGGTARIGREFGDLSKTLEGDQTLDIDKFTKESGLKLEDAFGKIDMLDPFKKAWHKVEDWWKARIAPFWAPIKDLWTQVVGSIDWSKPFEGLFKNSSAQGFAEHMREAWEKVKSVFKSAIDVIKAIIALFAPDVKRILDQVVQAWHDVVAKIGPELQKWAELLGPFLEALKNWGAVVMTYFLAIAKVFLSIVGHTIGPVFDLLIDTIQNVMQIIRGIIEVFTGLFTGDFGMMANGIKDIFQGLFDGIWDIIKGAVKIVWGVIEGFVGGIVGFFKWLYDELVGHSIVPDIVDGIIAVFKLLFALVKWIWDNVLKPVFDLFGKLNAAVFPVVSFLVTSIFTILKALWALAKWVWDNVLKPLVDIFVNLWEGNLKGALGALITLITNIFKGLWGLPKAIWDNVLAPIIAHFAVLWATHLAPIFNVLLRGIGNIWNAVGSGIAAGVNIGIKAINKLIDAINWVGKNVPGLSFSIKTLGEFTFQKWTPPQFATGGVLPKDVGEGFATNKARAIVGEGGRHPEYVIPTDPKHRKNALRLYGDLGKAIGGSWGINPPSLGDVWNTTKDVAGKVGGAVRKGAVIAAFAGPLKAFDAIMSAMPDKPSPIKGSVMQMKNDVYNWAKGIDKQIPEVGAIGNRNITGAGFQALIDYMHGTGIYNTVTSTVRPGDPGYHGLGRAADFSVAGHGDRGYASPGLREIFEGFLPIGQNLKELILAGAPFNIKDGKKVGGYAWGQPGQPGNHWNHVHAALQNGGITKSGQPIRALIGEGADRELVTPLTPLWNRLDRIESRQAATMNGGGDTINNFYGNLEFPNVKSGDDAESFIRNLEIAARK